MAIITEEMLRNKRLSKQLANGQLLVLPIGSFLTPAAKSYLRENRIHWSLADVQTITTDCHSINTSSSKKEKWPLSVLFELRHLHNLFYLPFLKDEELAAAGWLYIEKQQLWLERALQGEFSRVEQTVNQTELFEGMNQQRQWLYSLKEIQLQIEIIISLLKDNADKEAQHFRKWAAEVISTLTAANLN